MQVFSFLYCRPVYLSSRGHVWYCLTWSIVSSVIPCKISYCIKHHQFWSWRLVDSEDHLASIHLPAPCSFVYHLSRSSFNYLIVIHFLSSWLYVFISQPLIKLHHIQSIQDGHLTSPSDIVVDIRECSVRTKGEPYTHCQTSLSQTNAFNML